MQTTVKSKTDSDLHLEVKLDDGQLAPLVRQVFNLLRSDVKAPGFRPGKAPNEIVERELGSQRVQAELIELVAQKAYAQAQKEHSFTPLAAPKISLSKFVPYTEIEMSIEVETLPPVKLADYKKFKQQPAKVEVSDKEIEQVLQGLRIRAAQRTDVKRAAKSGDEVTMDFEGKQNGVAVAGAGSKNYALLLGSGRFVPGFEAKLIGAKAGTEKKFSITFPKDYFESSLQNQKIDFEVKVQKVTELKQPQLDDEFASSVGPFKSLAALKQNIETQIKAEKDDQALRQLETAVAEELVEKSQVQVPPKLVAAQLQQIQHDFEHELKTRKTTVDDYLKEQKKTKQELEDQFRPLAERRVKTGILLNEVAKAEKIDVTPEEFEIRLQLVKGQYKDPKIQANLERPEIRRDIVNQLMTEKTLAKLVDYATQLQT